MIKNPNEISEFIIAYGPQTIFREDDIEYGDKTKDIGHLVSTSLNPSDIGKFMDHTKNNSVAVHFEPQIQVLDSEGKFNTRPICDDNLFVYYDILPESVRNDEEIEKRGSVALIPLSEFNGRTMRLWEIENLTDEEFAIVFAKISTQNAFKRMRAIEAKNVINYDLQEERERIEQMINEVNDTPLGEMMVNR
jgi:hypothetical protein